MKMNEQNQEQMLRDIYKKAQMPKPVNDRMEETLRTLEQQEQGHSVIRQDTPRRKPRSSASRSFWTSGGFRRMIAAAAAAVLCIGGTVFAASCIYQMNLEKEKPYQANLHITSEEALPAEVAEVEIKVNYLPEGFALDPDKGLDYYYKNPQIEDVGYFIEPPLLLDQADPLTVSFVKDAESLTVNGHDAAFINKQNTSDETWNFGTLFVVYEDVGRILPVNMWGHAKKEELLKIAANIELVPTGKTVASTDLYRWSESVSRQMEDMEEMERLNAAQEDIWNTASAADMANLHQVGDTFAVHSYREADMSEISLNASVTDVQVADDMSLLTAADRIPDEWHELVGPDGKLTADTLNYIKYGNGADTLDEIVRTESSPLKLVYVTADFTNNGAETVNNAWFLLSLMSLVQEGDNYTIFNFADASCDEVENKHTSVGLREMPYYDVTGGARQNNYIPEIQPGQTVTVHAAWLVNADEVDNLYLDFTGNGYEFSQEALDMGLVKLSVE